MKKLLAVLPVFAAVLVLAGSGAHAFTFENNGPSSSNGSAIVDPDEQVKNSGNGSTSREGGTGFHFSAGPSSGSGLTNRSNSPPAWVGNPLFLDKGSSQPGQ
jgi:hypothetical protein